LTNRTERIREKLIEAFEPTEIEVSDDSARHAGHAGASAQGETHYNVTLIAEAFRGLGRVQAQRAIHGVLSDEFENGLHALSLKVSAPAGDGTG